MVATLSSFFAVKTPNQSLSGHKRGEEQGSKSPFSLLSELISPSSLLFEPISPSSLNVYLTFSPSSLLFPPISPSSQLFLGHFSLLPILFLPPLNNLVDYTCKWVWDMTDGVEVTMAIKLSGAVEGKCQEPSIQSNQTLKLYNIENDNWEKKKHEAPKPMKIKSVLLCPT